MKVGISKGHVRAYAALTRSLNVSPSKSGGEDDCTNRINDQQGTWFCRRAVRARKATVQLVPETNTEETKGLDAVTTLVVVAVSLNVCDVDLETERSE